MVYILQLSILMTYIFFFFIILSLSLPGCGSGGGGVSSNASPDVESPFTARLNISDTPGNSTSPIIAFDPVGGGMYVVWEDDSPGHKEIYFTRTAPGGHSFITPSSIYKSGYTSELPRIIIDHNSKIHRAWLYTIGSTGTKEVLYSSSIDGGANFINPMPISNIDNIGVSEVILSTNRFGNLLLAWIENNTLYSSRSIDGGLSFSLPKKISQTEKATKPYALADINGIYYIVWEDPVAGEILLSISSQDFGLTFSAPINLSHNSGISETPVLAAYGTDVYALWVDSTPSNRDIYIRRISNSGLSVNITSGFLADSKAPSAGIDGNTVHVVWEDHSSGNAEVMYARSSDRGVNFSGFKNLSNTATSSTKPQISVSSGVISVMWTEAVSPSNKELYLATSLDSGGTFSNPFNISEDPGASEEPLMGIDTSEIAHWVWVEEIQGNNDIYHRKERQ